MLNKWYRVCHASLGLSKWVCAKWLLFLFIFGKQHKREGRKNHNRVKVKNKNREQDEHKTSLVFICKSWDKLPDSTDIRSIEHLIGRKPSNRKLWTLTVSSWEQSWGIRKKETRKSNWLHICWDDVKPELDKYHEISKQRRNASEYCFTDWGKMACQWIELWKVELQTEEKEVPHYTNCQ